MSDLRRISALATQQLQLEREISGLEEQLKNTRDLHRQIAETDLPEAMEAAEMEEFVMKDGRKVSIKQTYHVEIPKDPERRGRAFSWLRDHGYGGLIKRFLRIEFGVGEDAKAEKVYNSLVRRKGLKDNSIISDETVHHSTLKSWAKKAMEDGEEVPVEDFGLYIKRFAEIGAVKR